MPGANAPGVDAVSPGFVPRPCPLCGSARAPRTLFSFTVRQYFDASPFYDEALREHLGLDPDRRFDVGRCACGFVYAPLAPDAGFLERLYAVTPEPAPGDPAHGGGPQTAARPEWAGRLLRILGDSLQRVAARSRHRPLRVLDVGCGWGVQLCALSRPGFPYRCTGVEVNPRAADFVRAAGVAVHPSLDALAAADPAPFDLVILNEILEHVPDPGALLAGAAARMGPASLLWIGVPDFGEARMAAIARSVERGDAPPRDLNPFEHLNYFSPRTLDTLAVRHGLRRAPGPGQLALAGGDGAAGAVRALLRLNVHALRVLLGHRALPEGFFERTG